MRLFDIFKKKKATLTKAQTEYYSKYDRVKKLCALHAEGKMASPYAELLVFQGQVENGGHYQYFDNLSVTGNLSNGMSALEQVLPPAFLKNLKQAHEEYLVLQKNPDDEAADSIMTQIDNWFFANEEELDRILMEYADSIG